MTVTLKQQLAMRQRPLESRIMYQEWRHLLFLHWEYEKEIIQKRLPEGLFVDTFQGNAYLTMVPFFIQNLRVGPLPPIPFLSQFIEVNVRTYVYDQEGNPGIYFFSLDINSQLVTLGARQFFLLPYHRATLTCEKRGENIRISGTRQAQKKHVQIEFEFSPLQSPFFEEKPGTLDFFLLERYALFTHKNNQLYIQRIHHAPYHLSDIKCIHHNLDLLTINGFKLQQKLPSAIHYCRGLDVDFFPLHIKK